LQKKGKKRGEKDRLSFLLPLLTARGERKGKGKERKEKKKSLSLHPATEGRKGGRGEEGKNPLLFDDPNPSNVGGEEKGEGEGFN